MFSLCQKFSVTPRFQTTKSVARRHSPVARAAVSQVLVAPCCCVEFV